MVCCYEQGKKGQVLKEKVKICFQELYKHECTKIGKKLSLIAIFKFSIYLCSPW